MLTHATPSRSANTVAINLEKGRSVSPVAHFCFAAGKTGQKAEEGESQR